MIRFNEEKTKLIYISKNNDSIVPSPQMNSVLVEHVNEHKHLGMIFNSTATSTDYINSIVQIVAKRIGVLRYLKWKLDRKSLTSPCLTSPFTPCTFDQFLTMLILYGTIVRSTKK